MRINSNIAALNTLNQLGKNEKATNSSLAKLSSGLRINSAADDAAGLAISEKMKGQIRGLDKASSNAEDGISLVQTAEGALTETESILQRMRELAVQSASDTNTDDDRANIQDEMKQLISEIDRISNTTQYNTMNLLDGSMSAAVTSDTNNILTNTGLGATEADGSTTLAGTSFLEDIADDNGDSLGFEDGDVIKTTWSVNGTLHTATYTVADAGAVDLDTALAALDDSSGTLAFSGGSITFTAAANGTSNAVEGLTFEVTDKDGNVKTDASNILSSFTETTAAKDAKATDGSVTLQIGANAGQTMKVSIGDMGSTALGLTNLDVSTQDGATVSIKVIDEATSKVSSQRSMLGAVQNRLEHTINNLDTASENLSSAQSQIADVDMAAEMMNYTKNNVLSQAAQAMLAQANQQPQQVLSLLK